MMLLVLRAMSSLSLAFSYSDLASLPIIDTRGWTGDHSTPHLSCCSVSTNCLSPMTMIQRRRKLGATSTLLTGRYLCRDVFVNLFFHSSDVEMLGLVCTVDLFPVPGPGQDPSSSRISPGPSYGRPGREDSRSPAALSSRGFTHSVSPSVPPLSNLSLNSSSSSSNGGTYPSSTPHTHTLSQSSFYLCAPRSGRTTSPLRFPFTDATFYDFL